MRRTNLAVDCAEGEALLSVDEAFSILAESAMVVTGCERVPVARAAGRVLVADAASAIPLPPFDHAAVDGYGIAAADLDRPPPHRLALVGRIAAGGTANIAISSGEALRLYTGAAIPPDVAAVVLEERCNVKSGAVVLSVPVPAGANIRRRGEDVVQGSAIVEAGSVLDARHVAILAAAGIEDIAVRRRVRVAVFSTGDELRRPGAPLEPGAIYDSNRPMLGALLSRPWIEIVSTEHVGDDTANFAGALRHLAGAADVILATGGAAGSDTDHTARAIVAAGGNARPLRVALRPGKPIVFGKIGPASVLGLPGNPVAAMVNFLLFGRSLILLHAGGKAERPRGQPAVAATPMPHSRGRTEFAPGRFVGIANDGRPLVEKLGKGGSARLRPLVLADGFVEISAEHGGLEVGDPVAFHPFQNAFSP